MSRWPKHARVDHKAAAEGLREMPGLWLQIGTYRSQQVARNMAAAIRYASRKIGPHYSPAGTYDAYTEPVGDETGVYVRYVGSPS